MAHVRLLIAIPLISLYIQLLMVMCWWFRVEVVVELILAEEVAEEL
jgi:hypothetical protein